MHGMEPSFVWVIYALPRGFGLDNSQRWTGMWDREAKTFSAI